MKITDNNISPETIDFYMQKSQQERSDAIFRAFNRLKCSITYMLRVLRIQKDVMAKDKTNPSDCRYAIQQK